MGELEYEETAKLVRRGVDADEAGSRATHLVAEMRTVFDDAEVGDYRGLEGTYGLPDPDDEHVVAAAVVGGAGAIVTLNSRDFPPAKLPEGVDVLTPREFAHNTVAMAPDTALRSIRAIARRSGRTGPPMTEADILLRLEERYGMHDAVELLRGAVSEE